VKGFLKKRLSFQRACQHRTRNAFPGSRGKCAIEIATAAASQI
jgi:hypothetical protein